MIINTKLLSEVISPFLSSLFFCLSYQNTLMSNYPGISNSYLLHSKQVFWTFKYVLRAYKHVLLTCNDILRVYKHVLQACNHVLRACKHTLRMYQHILRICNYTLRGCNDISRTCKHALRVFKYKLRRFKPILSSRNFEFDGICCLIKHP